jgi:hypothetical protein
MAQSSTRPLEIGIKNETFHFCWAESNLSHRGRQPFVSPLLPAYDAGLIDTGGDHRNVAGWRATGLPLYFGETF